MFRFRPYRKRFDPVQKHKKNIHRLFSRAKHCRVPLCYNFTRHLNTPLKTKVQQRIDMEPVDDELSPSLKGGFQPGSADDMAGPISITICMSIFLLAMGITCVVIGQAGRGQACQKQDRSGLTLSEFLLGEGIANLVTCGLMIIATIAGTCVGANCASCSTIGIVVLYMIFKVAWFIVGCIVFFRSNLDCVGEDTGILTVVVLILQWLSIASSGRGVAGSR